VLVAIRLISRWYQQVNKAHAKLRSPGERPNAQPKTKDTINRLCKGRVLGCPSVF